ncbi:MAG TPA: glycosyltransferase family 2 protein, partial [Thermoanaerobaculia bacterium]|nr:glycosyltransferase family 2 protein [Thermoanaerobaculia bacterium]
TRALTLRCLESLQREDGSEVVVVDDGSRDSTAAVVGERFPKVEVIRSDIARGFTASVNRGLAHVGGDVLLLLNSDTEVQAGWQEAVRGAFSAEGGLGIVGAQLYYPDGAPQWSGGAVPNWAWLFVLASGLAGVFRYLPGYRRVRSLEHGGRREVHWVTGAALAMRREVWEAVGAFDEEFRLYCQDLDYCHRAKREGWTVRIVPDFKVLHHHGATIGKLGGAVDDRDPHRLMTDLVRWAEKHRSARWAAIARGSLILGLGLRILGRFLRAPLLRPGERETWRRGSAAYLRALGALRTSGEVERT